MLSAPAPIPYQWTTNDYFTSSLNRGEPFNGTTKPKEFVGVAQAVEEGNSWAYGRLMPFADEKVLAAGSPYFSAIAKAANAWARARHWINEGQYDRSKREEDSAMKQMDAIIEGVKSLRGGKVRNIAVSSSQHRGIFLTPSQYATGGAVADAFSGIDR